MNLNKLYLYKAKLVWKYLKQQNILLNKLFSNKNSWYKTWELEKSINAV